MYYMRPIYTTHMGGMDVGALMLQSTYQFC